MPPPETSGLEALGASRLATAALQRLQELGAQHGDFRLERLREEHLRLHDGAVDASSDRETVGYGIRVVHAGSWGFAGGMDLDVDSVVRVAEQAVAAARLSAPLNPEPVVLAPEPAYPGVSWTAPCGVDPWSVPLADKVALLSDRSRRLLDAAGVTHVDAASHCASEAKYYVDTAGTSTTQQRIRVHPEVTVTHVDAGTGAFETMRTLAPPTARGWEYVTGAGWDWESELARLPELVLEKAAAPSVEPGRYDLVIDPTNLWLTIHESVGHATELDRALGYEANYAGTSFATPDQLGSLRYGSDLMHVTGDRTAPHGLATVGWDDEGVAAQQWDIVRDGVLVGYQLDRRIAALTGADRSNGCAFADSPLSIPIQRMANVSLQPDPAGGDLDALVAGVERGILVVGDKSWSIDMQRYNFQFTGQRFYLIRSGRLAGQVRDVVYQATTTDFWAALRALGGPSTYLLGGAFNCGKGQPGQVAAVSHGCPVAVFEGINVLNAMHEAGR